MEKGETGYEGERRRRIGWKKMKRDSSQAGKEEKRQRIERRRQKAGLGVGKGTGGGRRSGQKKD